MSDLISTRRRTTWAGSAPATTSFRTMAVVYTAKTTSSTVTTARNG